MAEFRHAETGAHLRRVPAYARILATDMARNSPWAASIDGVFLARLEESAPLHDIGKVAVPDRVLLKPGPLTDEEYEEAKLHAQYGRDICLSVKEKIGETESGFIDMAIAVTASHHERWDGQGYPSGLAGTDIPLSGHIVHMADLYDACRNPRVYRTEPIPRDELVEMIEQGRGTVFCPDLVDSFFRSLDSIVEVEQKITDFV
jgi:putative two-component system response regulator